MKSQNSLLLLLGVLSTTVLTAPTLPPDTASTSEDVVLTAPTLPLGNSLSTSDEVVLTAPTLPPGTTSEEGAAPVDENIRCFPTLADLPHDVIDNVNLRLDPLSSKTLQLLTNKESFGHLRRLDQEEELFDKMKLLVKDKEFFWAIINGDNDALRRLMPNMEGPSLLLGLQLAVQYGNADAAWLLLVWDTLHPEESNDKRKELELAAKNMLTETQLGDLAWVKSSNMAKEYLKQNCFEDELI